MPLVLDCFDPGSGDSEKEHCVEAKAAFMDVNMLGEQSDSVRTHVPIITRRDLFLESKVWPTELGYLPTSRAVRSSLQQLRTNYVDLYLLHWPK